MLTLDKLHAFYGKSHVLHGVSLAVGPGEIVALLGRNGSGRSTTAKAIMGLVDAHGSLLWRGQEILGLKTYQLAQLGLGYVPESRDVFPKLTVEQNLMLGQKHSHKAGRWSLDDMYALFPRLREKRDRLAGALSGGEQQQVAIARALMGRPRLLLMDEPSVGLSPIVVEGMVETIRDLNRTRGLTILIVEQNVGVAAAVAM